MTLRRLRWWDLPAAVAIERESFGADGWSETAFWSELAQYSTRHYLAAEPAGAGAGGGAGAGAQAGVGAGAGDELAGYAGLAAQAGEAFVQTLAVRRACWGQGLGAALLDALLTEAESHGARRVLLEVRVDNDRAQALYRRFGFAEVGRRRGYYQPSGTDALVMRRG